MAKTMKTAISLPKEDFEMIEKLRKETGMSRSQILLSAFHEIMKAKQIKEWEEQDAQAYRRMPEEKKETSEREAWLKLSAEVAKDHPW